MFARRFRPWAALLRPLALALLILLPLAPAALSQGGPPPVPGAGPKVFLVENGAQAGPFTMDQLKAKIADGSLGPSTLAWIEGMTDWTKAADVPALAELFGNTPPPPPPAPDAKTFLTGRWQSDPQQIPVEGVGPGTMTAWAEYDALGTAKAELTLVFQDGVGNRYTRVAKLQGTYSAAYKNADTITLTIKGQMVVETTSTTGTPIPPEMKQINETADIRVIDQNTLTDDQGGLSRRVMR